MPAHVVCAACGREHRLPERPFDPESGTTVCPNCGARRFDVRRTGITWHPGTGTGSDRT